MSNHSTGLIDAARAQTTDPPPSPNDDLAEAASAILDVGQSLLMQGEVLLGTLLRLWNAYQVLIAIGVFLAAHILRAFLGPRIREWMATREGWPKWRMRVLVVIHQRLRLIFFVLLI